MVEDLLREQPVLKNIARAVYAALMPEALAACADPFEQRLWRAFTASDVDRSHTMDRRELPEALKRAGFDAGDELEVRGMHLGEMARREGGGGRGGDHLAQCSSTYYSGLSHVGVARS